MKTVASLAFALSTLATVSAVEAQDRQVTVYSGAVGIEMPASILRGTASATPSSAGEPTTARKVRVVLQSPYGN